MGKIYLLLSQSGTLPSRLLKMYTHAEFNHISISLNSDLNEMYSFGRKYRLFPFPGGFISEAKERGIYAQYPKAKVVVLELEIDDDKLVYLRKRLQEMYAQKRRYHYNFRGVFFASLGLVYQRERNFYCSEFVRDILVECEVAKADDFPRIVMPVHFMHMPGIREVYRGQLCKYFG